LNVYASTTQAPVLVVGAAHVIDLNAPLRALFRERILDAIAVELDAERASRLLAPQPPPDDGVGGPIFLKLWGLLQRRLGASIGAGSPGAEMKTAAAIAQERKLPLFLIDDPIRETLGRLIRSMSLRERVAIAAGAFLGLFIPSRLVERQLANYTEAPTQYMAEVRQLYPTVARVLLDDRNEHMADRLTELRHRGYGRVAAVVGDAHVGGLAEALRRRGVPVETIPFRDLRAATVP
jgi:pheromone shutdown protein TraB